MKPDGTHLRRTTPKVAEALLAAEHAIVANQNGKIRAIKLVVVAANSAVRVGEATAPSSPLTVRFVRKLMLDSGHVIWEHHPRALEQ